MTIEIFAPAKVNLYLHVVGKRADGYHLLDSLIAFAGVGDSLTCAPADSVTLTVDGPTAPLLPPDGDNIVLKAARALAAKAGVTAAARLHLTKRLPVAAGIGGGSADAAAALKGLSALWGVTLAEAELRELALAIGADVPVCVAGRAMAVSGIGERMVPAPALPSCWLVLVNPMEPLSTPAVFKARTGCFSEHAPLETTPKDAAALAALLNARRNDLTEAAVSLVPAVGDALSLISEQSGCLLARMSGSGATCFGLFATEAEARAAEAAIAAARPGWWAAAAELLS
ncbi:MAG TPA: 4-(cytidine 5'-diphospho)-2-C-methyl-D-erythritol kinase [Candidatus Omnitrophota bacterium]|nr:4-(cytidine 5'-diphospho)-2-C-methyl-D-erythritol kinase [Candidatus Omnitrophota bacterium]